MTEMPARTSLPANRSEFADRGAEEVFSAYWRWYLRLRVLYVVLAVALGAFAIVGALNWQWVQYLAGLLGIVAVALFQQRQINQRFVGLTAIINTDCDVEKWRAVIERIQARSRRRRSRNLCACYLSTADCEEERYADAAARLEGVRFPRRSPLGLMVHQNRAVCAHELGDVAARDAAVAAMEGMRDRLKPGSAKRLLVEGQLRDLALSFKPHESWDDADAAHMRERLESVPTHRERVAWALKCAEYELLHGSTNEARSLLDERALEPMTPRSRARRDALTHELEGSL